MLLPTGRRVLAATAALAGCVVFLMACAPEPGASPAPADTSTAASATPTDPATPAPTPSPKATAVSLPTDCREILSEAVLAQLADTPLNDPGTGEPVGAQPDGTLVCLWRHPGADTTFLRTEITRMSRGPALDLLNELSAEGRLTCYTPDEGTRCEGTWPNPTYPVTDGRTLFWRDDVLIDTTFSNLAPTGYTNSIVAHLFGSA